jgi:hypothetical protein
MINNNRPSSSWRDIEFKGFTNPCERPNENTLPPPVGIPSSKILQTQSSSQTQNPNQSNNSSNNSPNPKK